MTRKPDDILDELEAALVGLKQSTLTGPNFDSIDELCSEWLKVRGYSVKKPVNYPIKIVKLDDLVQLFYLLFQKNYPDFIVPYNSTGHDRKIAKLFIESRMKAESINRTKALEQCATIIESFFTHKSSFKFDPAPTFGVFGQDNMGWVTTRVLNFMNAEKVELREKEAERIADEQTANLVASGMQIGWSQEVLDETYEKRGKRK